MGYCKKIKLEERERQYKSRTNIANISVPKKDEKSLCKQDTAKIVRLQERERHVKEGKLWKRYLYRIKEMIILYKKL